MILKLWLNWIKPILLTCIIVFIVDIVFLLLKIDEDFMIGWIAAFMFTKFKYKY